MAFNILGQSYAIEDVSRTLTVPDCNVLGPNKIGTGHGEGKFYFGTKEELSSFFGEGNAPIKCFFLRTDLLHYMEAIRLEYTNPSQPYVGATELPKLWEERFAKVKALPEFVSFEVRPQTQIIGPRGYLNADERDNPYHLFRTLSLPLVSYLTIMRLRQFDGKLLFYWKLFVDFEAIWQRKSRPLVFTYGRTGEINPVQEPAPPLITTTTTGGRSGQQTYRDKLLKECPFCPITTIADDRLLIASHIKPYAVCSDAEQFDPDNGFIFSPLYDKLFDQGFLSFTDDRKMKVSVWLSPKTQSLCAIREGLFVQSLPINERRAQYLDYHRRFVFKG